MASVGSSIELTYLHPAPRGQYAVAGRSGGPLIGQNVLSGLLIATGHSCWGIHNALVTGKLISEIIFEGEAIGADIRGMDPSHKYIDRQRR